MRTHGRGWCSWLLALAVLASGARADASDCTGDGDCLPGWTCDLLSGTCHGPAGAPCSHAGGCEGNICAGGRCCKDPCAYEHPECGGVCDETGACVYPPLYTGCHCDGGTATCWHGTCQCEPTDAGPPADAADGPDPATLCGCHASSSPPGAALALLLVLLPRRSSPRATRTS